MTISIAPELEAQIKERARSEGLSVQAYVERLIREDNEWSDREERPLDQNDSKFSEIVAAVAEGLAQAEQGQTQAAEEVFAELRAKHGISR